MAGNQKKVAKYYKKFQDASNGLDTYLEKVGESLFEAGYTDSTDEFIEQVDKRTEARENARLQFERVCREEQVGFGPVTVQHKTLTTYNGRYLYEALEDNPKLRDRVVEVVYKVKTAEFKKLTGELTAEQLTKSIASRKESVALKGVPSKIGLG